MVDPLKLRMWFYWALLVALAGLVIFVAMLPLSTLPAGWPGPDLLLALVCAWVLRRPEYVPVGLVAALFFLTDMLTLQPPGLRAALVVLAVEFLRRRAGQERPFVLEWGLVALVLGAVMLGERLVLGLALVDQVSFGKAALRLIATILAYPLVVAVSVWVLRVRRIQPGEADALRYAP